MGKKNSVVVFFRLSECGDWEVCERGPFGSDAAVRFDLDGSVAFEHITCTNGNITPRKLEQLLSFVHNLDVVFPR